jgi:hypothetical protein
MSSKSWVLFQPSRDCHSSESWNPVLSRCHSQSVLADEESRVGDGDWILGLNPRMTLLNNLNRLYDIAYETTNFIHDPQL